MINQITPTKDICQFVIIAIGPYHIYQILKMTKLNISITVFDCNFSSQNQTWWNQWEAYTQYSRGCG